jgi:hypothetical protein
MQAETQTARNSKTTIWVGWILSVLPALLFIASAAAKFAKPAPVVEGFSKLGYPEHLVLALGIVELSCALIYLIPRTCVLGAILLTGYIGGAIASHVRVGDPFYTHIGIGVVVWLGLYLRDPRLRALIPLRS